LTTIYLTRSNQPPSVLVQMLLQLKCNHLLMLWSNCLNTLSGCL